MAHPHTKTLVKLLKTPMPKMQHTHTQDTGAKQYTDAIHDLAKSQTNFVLHSLRSYMQCGLIGFVSHTYPFRELKQIKGYQMPLHNHIHVF